MELLVQLKPSEGSAQSNGQRRRSQREVRALQQENARYVGECLDKVRGSLPPSVTVKPVPNLNILLVSVPSPSDVDDVRERIRDVCSGVVSISDDVVLRAAAQYQ